MICILINSLKLRFSNGTIAKICPTAFAKAHNRGHTYYDKLVVLLKQGAKNGDTSMFNKHCTLKPSAVKHLIKIGGHYGMSLTSKEFMSATLPNTLLALYTATWMQEFFRLTGYDNFFASIYNIHFC
jgi:hypothetical protein